MKSPSYELYLNLLKKSLTGYLRIDNEIANAQPPQFWFKKSRWKNIRNRFVVSLARRMNMIVLKRDTRSLEQRKLDRVRGVDWPGLAETMTGLTRLDKLQEMIEEILNANIPGDLIETGVWRGGSSIFMKAVLNCHRVTDRRIWLCDSFEGLPPPEPDKYPEDAGDELFMFDILAVSKEEVIENFKRYDLLDDKVEFVKGYFADTLPDLEIGPLAMLRMDGDMYVSTMPVLTSLYDKVSPGGFIIVDDYRLNGCRKAIDEFREDRGITDEIIKIDGESVYWVKSKPTG